jgi:SAM-dependent methyltransferase
VLNSLRFKNLISGEPFSFSSAINALHRIHRLIGNDLGSTMIKQPLYYSDDLARIHHLGFGFHADRCAAGILAALAPIRERNGLVLELGCGGGHLTRHLLDAGHRVIATDASLSMLAIAQASLSGAEAIQQLILPDDPLPEADAIVAIGHVLNYLEDEIAIEKALRAIAGALRPRGILAIDMQDLQWGNQYRNVPSQTRVADDWVLVCEFSVPEPTRFVRRHIFFMRAEDNNWRRDEEIHHNVLMDTTLIPALLSEQGLMARVGQAFGEEELPHGLVTILGSKIAAEETDIH